MFGFERCWMSFALPEWRLLFIVALGPEGPAATGDAEPGDELVVAEARCDCSFGTEPSFDVDIVKYSNIQLTTIRLDLSQSLNWWESLKKKKKKKKRL